jgi:ADP-heptose:LPS heptosyltransferase
MTETKSLDLHFDHGLGDCCHFALLLQLYKRRGYRVRLHGEGNKEFVWKLAEVERIPHAGTRHHPWLYHSEFSNLGASDVATNKISFGIQTEPLPQLNESPELLWDELSKVQLRASSHISQEAHQEAEQFLKGLPRPIICLHSNGTNYSSQKNIPVEVAFNLIRELLRQTPGSVIILDWDGRAPSMGDERVKSIKPWWGHIDNDRLAALFERTDLMIGIDSGPFHFASFFDMPAIGVFRHMHPNRTCIPNPNAVYMVPARNHRHWVRCASDWSFCEYVGEEPTAAEIADQASALLSGVGCLGMEPLDTKQHAGRYRYIRFEESELGKIKDERIIELLVDGSVGVGRGGCEEVWYMRRKADQPGSGVLTLFGKGRPTCLLTQQNGQVWSGKWIRDEQMPIELVPVSLTQPIVIDCDSGEYCREAGDAVMASWIAEGAKAAGQRIEFRAGGEKRNLLQMLGQQVAEHHNGVSLSDCFDLERRDSGTVPRATRWARFIGANGIPTAPRVTIPPKDREFAELVLVDPGSVLLFPETTDVARSWPHWNELQTMLFAVGVHATTITKFICSGEWPKTAALINRAALIIGVDSCPIHLAGTLNIPAIAILGPTRPSTFEIYSSVKCLSVSSAVSECVGCSLGGAFSQDVCRKKCKSLELLHPAVVFAEALRRISR